MVVLSDYITDRSQMICIDNIRSLPHPLKYGIPQGSVLGPTLFNMYFYGIGDLFREHGLQMHQYADDTQLYCTFKPAEIIGMLSRIEGALCKIRDWLLVNKLKLNDSKLVAMILHSKYMQPPHKHYSNKGR